MKEIKLVLPAKNRIFFTSEHDVPPSRYYGNPVVNYFYRKRLKMVIDMIEPGKRVLDIGFGSGILIPTLKKAFKEVHGVDIHDNVKRVQEIFGGNLKRASVKNMPYKNNYFDCAVCISVLEHMKGLKNALNEIRRVLRPKGSVVFGIPSDNILVNTWFRIIKTGVSDMHINSYNDITVSVNDAFEVERKEKFMSIYTSLKCRK